MITSSELLEITSNEKFWKQKFMMDFKDINIDYTNKTWKYIYCNYDRVYTFGKCEKFGLKQCSIPTLVPKIRAKYILYNSETTYIINHNNMVINMKNNPIAFINSLNNESDIIKLVGPLNGDTIIKNADGYLYVFVNGVVHQAYTINNNSMYVINGISLKMLKYNNSRNMFIDSNNNLWATGYNNRGQLGLGDNRDRNIFERINNIKVKNVECGPYHTVIIDINDTVLTCGINDIGQLGTGYNLKNSFIFKLVYHLDNKTKLKAKRISCGIDFTVVIDLNDDVYGFGSNIHGQLGLGPNVECACYPLKINIDNCVKAKEVFCNEYMTAIIRL
jgi:hypothetical protein